MDRIYRKIWIEFANVISIIILIALYFVVKWAVKNGIKDAYEDITGKEIKYDLYEIMEKELEENKKSKVIAKLKSIEEK